MRISNENGSVWTKETNATVWPKIFCGNHHHLIWKPAYREKKQLTAKADQSKHFHFRICKASDVVQIFATTRTTANNE